MNIINSISNLCFHFSKETECKTAALRAPDISESQISLLQTHLSRNKTDLKVQMTEIVDIQMPDDPSGDRIDFFSEQLIKV